LARSLALAAAGFLGPGPLHRFYESQHRCTPEPHGPAEFHARDRRLPETGECWRTNAGDTRRSSATSATVTRGSSCSAIFGHFSFAAVSSHAVHFLNAPSVERCSSRRPWLSGSGSRENTRQERCCWLP
jgi:hypothetical protein